MAPFVGCPVEVYQNEQELMQLLGLYRDLQPRRVLEIGAMFGGTLWYWMRETLPGATFAVIDLPVSSHDERHGRVMASRALWQGWADAKRHDLTVIDLPSQHPNAKAALPFESVDFLHIDADHRYEAVKADYLRYAPIVRSGGMIALHDVCANDGPGFGTQRFWHELQAEGLDTQTISVQPNGWGIGVIHVS